MAKSLLRGILNGDRASLARAITLGEGAMTDTVSSSGTAAGAYRL